jgi:YbbR domain-containing protein
MPSGNGSLIISKTATPETVSIQAVDSVVNSVGSVKVFVDVTNLNKTLEVKKECKVYNKKGEEMPELAKKLFADVKIDVGKRVPVIPIIQGKPAKDFVDGEFTVKPDKILIMGDAQTMAKTNELRTQPIDITNAAAPINAPVLIVVPEGLKLVSSSREVIVTVDISALEERVFQIPIENINIEGNPADVTFTREITSPVSIKLKGKKDDLDKLTVPDIAPSINITGLNEGTHNIPINVTLPDTVKMIEETLVQVKIKKGA